LYSFGQEPDRAMWKKAHELYLQAFKEPTTVPNKKKLAKVLKKPVREDVANELFAYDSFLRGLGRMSLSELLVLLDYLLLKRIPSFSGLQISRHMEDSIPSTRTSTTLARLIYLSDISIKRPVCRASRSSQQRTSR
jgi:hypothetical protein